MKSIIEFDLPEEDEEYRNAMAGTKLSGVLFEMDQYLRTNIKYREHSDEVMIVYEDIRTHLHSLAREAGVEI